ncbi:hypothetical protein BH23VER1_BH23VER1_24420 [soil metagenome]
MTSTRPTIRIRRPVPGIRLIGLICGLWAIWQPTAAPAGDGLDPESPEYAAITLAAPDIKRDKFELRDDFWSGELREEAGKAIRLQLFKGNTYKLFFAVGTDEAEKGTKVFLKVMSRENEVVAESKGKKGSATSVEIDPPATGLYLVLMRIETKGDDDRSVACALFYGYE